MPKKIVAVVGATGSQGGSVANALLANGKYTVRALTRRASSDAAKALAAKGAEIVEADITDEESLTKAFEDAYAVYGMTVIGETSEYDDGCRLVDAAKANNVELFVWASLPNATATSGGKYTGMNHYDDKAAVDHYIKRVGQPAVIIHLGFFTDNLVNYHQLRPSPDEPGTYNLHTPIIKDHSVVPHTWIEGDLGCSVAAIIDNWHHEGARAALTKEPIQVCSYKISGAEMVATIGRVIGKKVTYTPVQGFVYDEDRTQMFHYLDEGMFPDQPAPLPLLVKLGAKFSTFEDFVKAKIHPSFKS